MVNEPGKATYVDRKISQARLALGFERLWTALYWPLLILAAAAALVIGGVFPQLLLWARGVLLATVAAAFIWSLIPLIRVLRAGWPSRGEAMRRVEERTGLAHRPVSARDDKLPDDVTSHAQQVLWQEHRLRQLKDLGHLKAGVPASRWRDIDPRALRLPVALALVAALLLGPGTVRSNLADSLAMTSPAPAPQLAVFRWKNSRWYLVAQGNFNLPRRSAGTT